MRVSNVPTLHYYFDRKTVRKWSGKRKKPTMPATEERPTLRLVTYMCPSHPVEMFETIMAYLEEEVKVKAVLQYESRHPGPLPDREDPFEHDLIDLGKLNDFNTYFVHDIQIFPSLW